MKTVSTIRELIQALGGVTKAAEIFGEEVNVVGNWKLRDKMPSNKFLEHQSVLIRFDIKAPSSFWFTERRSASPSISAQAERAS